MALVKCEKCRGQGKINGMGSIVRTCAVCEGDGEYSDTVTITEVFDGRSKLARKAKMEARNGDSEKE